MPSATICRETHFRFWRVVLPSILWIVSLVSCGNNKDAVEICRTNIGSVVVANGSDSMATLLHIDSNGDTLSQWPLHHSVYHFDYGDLVGDGVPEIVVGVIKKTKYWRTEDRRLFVFKLYKGELIRPLWLGSRLGCPILTFRIERDSMPARIVSTEQCSDTIIQAMYRIKGFGPKFENYINN